MIGISFGKMAPLSEEFRPRAMTLPSKQKQQNGDGEQSPGHVVDTHSIARSLKHSTSLDITTAASLDLKNEAKVLVLYTGGTIGMVRNHAGVLVPEAAAMEAGLRRIVTMHDEQYSQMRFGGGGPGGVAPGGPLPLVLPSVPGHKRVVYTIYEYVQYLHYLQYLQYLHYLQYLQYVFTSSSTVYPGTTPCWTAAT